MLSLHDETIDDTKPFRLFHPEYTWKSKIVDNFEARELLVPIFKNGELVYDPPKLHDIRRYCLDSIEHLWAEVKRFENPHEYYVDLTQKLWEIKKGLLESEGAIKKR